MMEIEDYKVLACAIDWNDELSHLPNSKSLHLLDIGCGTGRWLEVIQDELLISNNSCFIRCDLLDPSKIAIQEAMKKLKPPFLRGNAFQSNIQTVSLNTSYYDIIWAMHSFYSIPNSDLPCIIKKCLSSLKPQGTIFLALPPQQSFYIQCYDQFRSIFDFDQIDAYTSADNVLDYLNSLGLMSKITKIQYKEIIEVDDLQKLSHYILHECIGYSFNRDSNTVKAFTIDDFLNHPNFGTFLQSYRIGEQYVFEQKVWLLTIKK